MTMSHHDHPWQLVAASWRRKGLAEIAEKRKKKQFQLANICPLTFRFCSADNEWKTKRRGERGLVGVLLKVRQEWVKQEGLETDDVSLFPPGQRSAGMRSRRPRRLPLTVMWTMDWLELWGLLFTTATTQMFGGGATVFRLKWPLCSFKKGQASVLVGRFLIGKL